MNQVHNLSFKMVELGANTASTKGLGLAPTPGSSQPSLILVQGDLTPLSHFCKHLYTHDACKPMKAHIHKNITIQNSGIQLKKIRIFKTQPDNGQNFIPKLITNL